MSVCRDNIYKCNVSIIIFLLNVSHTLGVHLELSVQQINSADTVVQLQRHCLLLVRIVLAVVNNFLVPLHSYLSEPHLIISYRGEDLVVELAHSEHGDHGGSDQVV